MRGDSRQQSRREQLGRLLQRQHGLLTWAQAPSAGVSRWQLRRSPSHRWERVGGGVYRHPAYPPTWRQELMAAVLAYGPGTVVSHRAAAVLHQLDGLPSEPRRPAHSTGPVAPAGAARRPAVAIEVTVPPGRSCRAHLPFTVTVHHSAQLSRIDVETVSGIPTTTPTRTLIDLGAVTDAGTVELALESALRARRTSLPHLRRRLQAVAGRGRRGTAAIRHALECHAGGPPTESELETRFSQLLRRAGLPSGIRQYEVRAAGELVARVDRAYPEHRLLVELDGFGVHSSPGARRRDLRRQNNLELALPGATVLRFDWQDVVGSADLTASKMAAALRLTRSKRPLVPPPRSHSRRQRRRRPPPAPAARPRPGGP